MTTGDKKQNTSLLIIYGLPALTVLLGALIGSWFTYLVQSRHVDVKLVEIAVGILRAEPKENIRPAREWAAKVLVKYSDVALSDEAMKALMNYRLPIRYLNGNGNGNGNIRRDLNEERPAQ